MSNPHGFFPPGDIDLLFVVGADDDRRLVQRNGRVSVAGTSDVHGLLQGPTGDVPYHRLHLTPRLARTAPPLDLSRYRTLVNLVTEPEDNRRTLGLIEKMTAGSTVRIVNSVEAVRTSSRDQMARILEDIPGLIVPRVIRIPSPGKGDLLKAITKAGLTFPVIVRAAGTHTGRIVGRFDEPGAIPARVQDRGDHLVTEFVEFASADGMYRKYRVWFFGERMLIKHLFVSDQWNVHGSDRKRFMAGKDPIVNEERALFARPEGAFEPRVIDTLLAVRRRVPLDFFGIDFGVMPDGRLVLFEANATMNFLVFSTDPQFAYLRKSWAPARAAFRELVGAPPE